MPPRLVAPKTFLAAPCLLIWSATSLVACSDDKTPAQASTSAGANSVGGAGASTGGASAGSPGGSVGGIGGPTTAGAAGSGVATGGAGTTAGAGGSAGGGTPCAGALICDDFEAYTGQPAAPWKVSTNQGTVAIDTTRFTSGKQSVKFSTTGVNTYQRAFIGLEGAPFPIAGNAFYGRMMIYATSAANDGVHWTMIEADGPVAAQSITNAQVRYGGQQMKSLMANYDSTGKKSDCWQHSATKMPEAQWACMQWYFDGKTNTQKFWLNGTAIEDLTVVDYGTGCIDHSTGDQWFFPQDFSKAYVGWESYQKDDAREIWIDDVAIGTQPIACPTGGGISTG